MKKLLLAVPLALGVLALSPSDEPFDLLITGGRVVDGTGAPWFARTSACAAGRSRRRFARGAAREADHRRDRPLRLPGFIDLLGQSEYNVLVDKRAASKITQGITTEVTGEGSSIAPLNDAMLAEAADVYKRYGFTPDFRTLGGYFETFQKRGSAINLATFVGAGSVRDFVIGKEDRRATPQELAKMQEVVDQAMRDGALGVSSSLQYVPDMYNSTDELIAMAKVAAKYGGAYFTHQRSEANAIDSSLDEVFRISKEAGIRSQIWHLKTAYKKNWGRMPAVLQRIADARAPGHRRRGEPVPVDGRLERPRRVPAAVGPRGRTGGAAQASRRSEAAREGEGRHARRLGPVEQPVPRLRRSGRVLIASVVNPSLKKYEGKTVAQMGADEKKDPRDALIDLVVADRANTACIIFMMDEKDVQTALASPLVAFCTDSGAGATDGHLLEEKSHRGRWASTARILGKYVRDEKVVRLEEAVRKMTSFPAEGAG
jgi:dihydroorotase/N-acyl-D-amino-acid deacylase